jgi:hypothetical protein
MDIVKLLTIALQTWWHMIAISLFALVMTYYLKTKKSQELEDKQSRRDSRREKRRRKYR